MTKPTRAPGSHLPLTSSMLHILLALGESPLHGYGIMSAVSSRTGGKTRLGPGNLYGSIQRLLEDGLIREKPAGRGKKESRRRTYELTDLGRRVATLESERLRELVEWARAGKLLKPQRSTR